MIVVRGLGGRSHLHPYLPSKYQTGCGWGRLARLFWNPPILSVYSNIILTNQFFFLFHLQCGFYWNCQNSMYILHETKLSSLHSNRWLPAAPWFVSVRWCPHPATQGSAQSWTHVAAVKCALLSSTKTATMGSRATTTKASSATTATMWSGRTASAGVRISLAAAQYTCKSRDTLALGGWA